MELQRVDDPHSSPRTVHPRLPLRLAAPAAYLGMFVLAVTDGQSRDAGELAATAFFGVIAGLMAATAIRQRMIIEGDEVRILRLISDDRVPLAAIDHVARNAGRGKPAHLALRPGSRIDTWTPHLRRRPTRVARNATGVGLPSLMTACQLAQALDVPLTTFGGQPIDEADEPASTRS